MIAFPVLAGRFANEASLRFATMLRVHALAIPAFCGATKLYAPAPTA